MIATIGGIDESLFEFKFKVCRQTNKEEVADFLTRLLYEAPVPVADMVIVLDNHSSHRAKLISDFAEQR